MDLTASIESAEHSLRQILEDFFVSVYDEGILPSHGLTHHRRVWRYAREILPILLLKDDTPAACDPEELIIACYMHDIGMSQDPGPRHGKKSREICQKFLISRNFDLNQYNGLLKTIENHDNKDYTVTDHPNLLLTTLSLADDLDAFGFTGIYRYCEIYLRRGISPACLGELVRNNALVRFDNFSRILSAGREYVAGHRKRFEILDNFFRSYNELADAYDFGSGKPEGYCGVVHLFIVMNRKKLSLPDLFEDAGNYADDNIIAWYLNGIRTELSDFNPHE